MKNQLVTGLWIGDTLPEIIELCIASYLKHGHKFQLFCYKTYDNIPEGTIVQNANDLIDVNCLFNPGLFTDWFRWVYLAKYGGWFTDMDMLCVSDDLPDFNIWMGQDTPTSVGTYLIKFPKKHPGIVQLAEGAGDPCSIFEWTDEKEQQEKNKLLWKDKDVHHRRKHHIYWPKYGKDEFKKLVDYYNLNSYVLPTHFANPLDWKQSYKYFNGDLTNEDFIIKQAFALHLYYCTCCLHNFKMIREAKENSIYRVALEKYLNK